jgi:hypothetical protein
MAQMLQIQKWPKGQKEHKGPKGKKWPKDKFSIGGKNCPKTKLTKMVKCP